MPSGFGVISPRRVSSLRLPYISFDCGIIWGGGGNVGVIRYVDVRASNYFGPYSFPSPPFKVGLQDLFHGCIQ